MKLVLAYMNVSNLGDRVIYETARYLVERILREAGRTDVEIVPMDIGSYVYRNAVNGEPPRTVVAKRFVARWLKRFFRIGLINRGFPRMTAAFLRWQWHRSGGYAHYRRNEKPKLQGADCVVFAGGGLVKFHRQNFHYFLDDVIGYADDHGIPVIINAVGVEGYDGSNPECRLLKSALNRSCVKSVTTRDDYAMLKDKYIVNSAISVQAVCDPAFWTAETYGVSAHGQESGRVGLNVIRTEIFKDYMYPVDDDEMIALYAELIGRLRKRGKTVELFSNGVAGDTKFIDRLFAAHEELKTDEGVTVALPETTRQLVETIAGYERFMAVRLHASIIGTVLGIPNVSLVWNRKQPLFGEQVKMPQNYIQKEGFSAGVVEKRLFHAVPYEMDEEYKSSVLMSLEASLGPLLRGSDHGN